ncbi:MAG: alpha-ketoacid dehydrogenase subunit beta [Acidobacteriota bacterium]|nr:alpha-ketoacid dehydrogenase subunit beta [Acidobacteriota bacterium]MDE3093300.1 alpha-ketoacid dehydrogenase subunit beta [Acidobacteriota bacterium]MDE3139610.1 alpha-ketoacid dehydrogenase subunit beta [Acidobacteriota bacterium]MDE3146727.1 alpha-ketoacid dehydrogenase subunit beta [Acidobacteriota bacterium]
MITTMTMAKALNEGLRRAMELDPKVLLMGEDIGKLGGVFRITDGLQKDFGQDRVIDTPLAESAIVGTAVGLAIRGYRAVCEMQFDGFVFPAFDQIVSQVAKLHKRSDGVYTMGLVIRLPFQGGIGAIEHHSESPEAYFAHTPGLRVVSCSTPNDAYWMIQQAIRSDDPIIFCEPKSRYWEKGEVDLDNPPRGLYDAVVRREGTDVTVVGYGSSVKTMLRAAETAAAEGTSLEVIDLRGVAPIDFATLTASLNKTGRLIAVQEAPRTASIGSEIVAELTERCFYSMRAPGVRVAGYHVPYPPARIEEEYRPSVERILDAVDRVMDFEG